MIVYFILKLENRISFVFRCCAVEVTGVLGFIKLKIAFIKPWNKLFKMQNITYTLKINFLLLLLLLKLWKIMSGKKSKIKLERHLLIKSKKLTSKLLIIRVTFTIENHKPTTTRCDNRIATLLLPKFKHILRYFYYNLQVRWQNLDMQNKINEKYTFKFSKIERDF